MTCARFTFTLNAFVLAVLVWIGGINARSSDRLVLLFEFIVVLIYSSVEEGCDFARLAVHALLCGSNVQEFRVAFLLTLSIQF